MSPFRNSLTAGMSTGWKRSATNSIANELRLRRATASLIANAMKIRLKIADKEITATLIDSETTRDFVSLLPLKLIMNDLFGREKSGHLPRAISEGASGPGITKLVT